MKTLTGIGSRVMGQLGKVGAVLLTLSMSTNILAASGSGTTGAEYLKIGVGAREVAMAGAVAAIVNDGHSLYWNPAGAAKVDAQRLDASYNNLYQDTNQGFISYSHPTSIGVWSGGINYLQISKIERRLSDTGSPDYTFTSKDSEFLLSYARANVAPGLALGGSVKYLQSYLDSANAHAFALDFGAQYQKSDMPWALGASLVNLGSGLKYVNATEPLPLGVKLGGAYQLLDRKLLLALGMDSWIRSRRTFGDFGLEYKPIPLIALRAGYQIGHGQDQLGSKAVGVSAGIGFNFQRLNIDYAYVPFGDLGSTQRFTIGFKFGAGSDNTEVMKPH